MKTWELDHIVVCAASLEQGVAYIQEKLDVEIGPGGKHPQMSTHNRLMRLGETAFLEVISIDPDAPPPGRPRWYGLDDPSVRARIAASPRLLTWVVRGPDIAEAASAATYDVGEVLSLRRDALTWRLTVPADGGIPEGGALPHVIQWDNGLRPWERMAERGCRLEALVVTHPQPEEIEASLRSIGGAGTNLLHVKQGPAAHLSARIVIPDGSTVALD